MRLEKNPPKRGCKQLLPAVIKAALADTISSFIGLACAKQQKTPTRKELINIISSCWREGPTPLCNCEVLSKKLYHRFSTDVAIVSDSSSIENRQALYTRCSNLDVSFDTLKKFLISKGLAREHNDDEDEDGE